MNAHSATVNQLIKTALKYLLTVQKITTRPAFEVMILDILVIKEKNDKAVIVLQAANAMLAEEEI